MRLLNVHRAVMLRAIIAGVIVLGTGGCDFLGRNTEGVLSPESFYKTREDLDAAVTSAWEPLLAGRNKAYAGAGFAAPSVGGDDWSAKPSHPRLIGFDRFNPGPTNKFVERNWSIPYEAIYRANTLIENGGGADVSDEVKNRALAQARFLRGWLYFRLVRVFGPVPLMVSSEADLDVGRTPVREVYDQVVEDLRFAEQHLPSSWSDGGRPTNWAAKAMLARVYLTMAGWPLHDESKYAMARDKYAEVIDGGQYRLLDNVADLWKVENPFNDEFVFALAYCQPCHMGNALTGSTTSPPEEGGNGNLPAEIQFFKDFPEGPRKDATYHTVFAGGTNWEDSQSGHPYFAKWRSGTTIGGGGVHRKFSSRSFPVVRYAHVLLGYAEAQAMASGSPDASAYEAVNQVRNRAGLPDLTPGLGATAFRDAVIEERGWEFAGEYTRWFDLVRTEKVAEANADKAPGDEKPVREISSLPKEHYYWLPIPQSEIELSPQLTQNPGH